MLLISPGGLFCCSCYDFSLQHSQNAQQEREQSKLCEEEKVSCSICYVGKVEQEQNERCSAKEECYAWLAFPAGGACPPDENTKYKRDGSSSTLKIPERMRVGCWQEKEDSCDCAGSECRSKSEKPAIAAVKGSVVNREADI